jgi:hypothetical protein
VEPGTAGHHPARRSLKETDDMTTSTLDHLLATADTIEQQTAARRAALAAEHASARAAAEQAEALADQLATEERAAVLNGGRQFITEMRRLTTEVRAARKAAATAVHTGDGDPLTLWLSYRRIRARNQGSWLALAGQYHRVVGSEAPPGAWGPPVIRDGDEAERPETFADFLTAEIVAAEREIRRQQKADTAATIGARRGIPADED